MTDECVLVEDYAALHDECTSWCSRAASSISSAHAYGEESTSETETDGEGDEASGGVFFASEEMLRSAKEIVASHVLVAIESLSIFKHASSSSGFERLYRSVFKMAPPPEQESVDVVGKRAKKLLMYCELMDFNVELERNPLPFLELFVQRCPQSEPIVRSPEWTSIVQLIQAALLLITNQIARDMQGLGGQRTC